MEALTPFRLVGNVCADVPVSFTMLYEQPVLMVATGRTFQLYRGNELSLLRGGPTFNKRVRAVTHTSKYRFAAEGGNIHAFSHHKPMWTHVHAPIVESKVSLLCARDDLLFSVGEDKTIVVWEIRSGERLQTIQIHGSETPTCICFADGYNNKLLIGTIEGSVQLYNYQTGAFLFSSRKDAPAPVDPRIPTSTPQVLCLTCSKYRDIVAYGTSSGDVVVYNYRTDKVVVSFHHNDTSVTSVCFRDDVDGQVISGTTHGDMAVWDIQERTLHGMISRTKQVRSREEVLDNPHTASVHSLLWYPGAQVLVSAGGDNALLQFRFDTIDGLGLLVRERRGHMGSCTSSHFFNSDLVVTAGADQALRVTHVFSDRASWELSQGKIGKRQRETQQSRDLIKLSPATALASSTNRNYQWSSLVSIHDCSTQLCGWRMDTRALEMKLSGISTTMHTSRCVTVSQCGNFAMVGYSSGHLVSIHLQNKSIRHFLQHDKTAPRSQNGVGGVGGGHARDANKTAHAGSVEAVQVCKGNSVVASCGTDGNMILWDLLTTDLIRIVNLGISVTSTSSCLHPESSFMMVGCVDFSIRAFSCDPDVADGSALRCLNGHSSSITSMAITPDTFQHLVSASSDNALMVWDLAAGVCVGAYRTLSPALSLSFHPDSLFLLSCHAGERGAFLWTNNLRYGFAPEFVEAPEKLDVESLPLLHYPLAHTEDADLDAAAVVAASRKLKDAAGKAVGSSSVDSTMVKMSSTQQDANLEKFERDEDSDEEGVSAKASKKDRARALKEGVELFDAKKDVALMLKARQEATKKRLNSIPEEGRIVLSGVPTSVWSTLTMLDAIKQRNQPILPPKKHNLPFFLPSSQDLRPSFVVLLEEDEKKKDNAAAGISGINDTSSLSPWHRVLYSTAAEIQANPASPVNEGAAKAYETCMRYFKDRNSNASEIDMEVKRTIDMDEGLLIKSEEVKKEKARSLVVQRIASSKDGSTAAGASVPTKPATSGKKKGVKADESEKEVVDGDLLLGTSDGYTDAEVYDAIIRLSMLFRFVAYHIASGKDSDLAQGILGAAIKAHGSIATYLASVPMDGLVLSPILPADDTDKAQHKQLLVRIGASKAGASATPNPLAVAMEKCLDAQEAFKASLDHLVGLPQALVSVFTMSYS